MSLNVRCGDCGRYATWCPSGYYCDCGWRDEPEAEAYIVNGRDGLAWL